MPTHQEWLDCGCLVQITEGTDGMSLLEPCPKHDDRPAPPRLTDEQLHKLVEMIRKA